MTINLGDEVQDIITGFKGTAVARTQWITGCDRITIAPKVKKDGTPPDPCSFDIGTVKVLKRGSFKAPKAEIDETEKETKGGPRPEPIKR